MTIEILNWALSAASDAPLSQPVAKVWDVRVVAPGETRQVMCDVTGQWRAAGVFERDSLSAGDQVPGPALIVEPQTTSFVSADFTATIDGAGNIWMQREAAQ
jgi:N-methylhydantoinase A